MFSFRVCAALTASLIFASCAWAAPVAKIWNTKTLNSESHFLAISEFARQGMAQQSEEIPQLYQSLHQFAFLNRMRISTHLHDHYPELTAAEQQLPAQQQLDLASERGNPYYAAQQGYRLALQVLRAHPDEVAAFCRTRIRACV